MTNSSKSKIFKDKCPHCGTDLTNEWRRVKASWDGHSWKSEINCPECGKDTTNPPKLTDMQFSANMPPEPQTEITFDTFDTLKQTFDIEPPMWTTRHSVDEPIRQFQPDDQSTWVISDVKENSRTMLAHGTLPLKAQYDGIPVSLRRAFSSVILEINEDSTIRLTSPQQLPIQVYDRIHVQRLDETQDDECRNTDR